MDDGQGTATLAALSELVLLWARIGDVMNDPDVPVWRKDQLRAAVAEHVDGALGRAK